MAYTNEQLAVLFDERFKWNADQLTHLEMRLSAQILALKEDLGSANKRLSEINGDVRKHEGDIIALKVKISKAEKKWDLLWLAILSPILSAVVSAALAVILK